MEYVRWNPDGKGTARIYTWHARAEGRNLTVCGLKVQFRHDTIKGRPIPMVHLCGACIKEMVDIVDRYFEEARQNNL